MKKVSIIVLSLILFNSFAFSKNFFSQRYFEIVYDMPAGVSNNTFSLNEILVKDLVIDLNRIAGKVPQEGWILTTQTKPQLSLNLNLPLFSVGFDTGIDVNERFVISKDFFNFFGYGNEIGEEMEFDFDNYTDVYLYLNTKFSMNIYDYKLKVMPTLFIPLISSSGTAGSFTAINDESGSLGFKLKSEMSYYSSISTDDLTTILDPQLIQLVGVDVTGAVEFPVNDMAKMRVSGRIPVVPGRLTQVTYVDTEYSMNTSVSELSTAEIKSTEIVMATTEEVNYFNRPLKANAYYEVCPMGSLITFTVGAGAGIYHPFVEQAQIYPEYYLSALFSMADMIKITVSTEYTDQIFKHQLTTAFNLRIIELDAGISLQSASFTKSFAATGMGGFVTVSLGF